MTVNANEKYKRTGLRTYNEVTPDKTVIYWLEYATHPIPELPVQDSWDASAINSAYTNYGGTATAVGMCVSVKGNITDKVWSKDDCNGNRSFLCEYSAFLMLS